MSYLVHLHVQQHSWACHNAKDSRRDSVSLHHLDAARGVWCQKRIGALRCNLFCMHTACQMSKSKAGVHQHCLLNSKPLVGCVCLQEERRAQLPKYAPKQMHTQVKHVQLLVHCLL